MVDNIWLFLAGCMAATCIAGAIAGFYEHDWAKIFWPASCLIWVVIAVMIKYSGGR